MSKSKIKKILNEWRVTIFLGILILMVALVLRLYHLDLLPVFADEAIYVRWAQVMRAEPTLRFVPLSDGKQPLFMWSTIPFLKLISNPVIAGRMVSVLAGVGSLIGVFVLTYYLFKSKKAALVASLIYATSPFSVFFDRMALVDSMLTMFGVWILLLAILTVRTLRLDFAMLTGFALGGALLTKSPALFFTLLIPSVYFLSKWPKKKDEIIFHLVKLMSLTVVIYVIGYGMFNILRLGPNFHMLGIRNQDYVFPLNHLWTNPKDPFIFHFHRSLQWLWIMGPSVFVVLVVVGFGGNIKKYWKQLLVVGLWGMGPLLAQSMFARVFTARYVLFSIPPLMVVAATTYLSLVSAATKGKLKNIFLMMLAVFVIHAVYINWFLLTDIEAAPLPRGERSGYLEEWTAGTGIAEVAELIKQEWDKDPTGTIVVGTEGYFGTLPDALQAYLNDFKDIIVIGIGIDIKSLPDSLFESKKAGNRTYLVINDSRLIADSDELGLELIKVFPKAKRPQGSEKYIELGPQDSLNFYEVTEEAISP